METQYQAAASKSRSQPVQGPSTEAASELTVELVVCSTILVGLFAVISTLIR